MVDAIFQCCVRALLHGHPLLRTATLTVALVGALPVASADPHPGHGPLVIAIGDLAYSPAQATITEGDYVLWNWQGPDTDHTATSDPGQSVEFDSDKGKSPEQVNHPVNDGFSVQYTKPGTYTFHCRVHTTMTGKITVLALPASLQPQPLTKPKLSRVKVTPAKLCHKPRCAHTGVTVRFTLNQAVSMVATVRRLSGSHVTGKTIKEIDFSGPPGTNRKRLDLGPLRHGRYQLKLVAIDQSSGDATKPVLRKVVVP